jgi:hypothetical protein
MRSIPKGNLLRRHRIINWFPEWYGFFFTNKYDTAIYEWCLFLGFFELQKLKREKWDAGHGS